MAVPLQPAVSTQVDRLQVRVYADRDALGAAAGADVAVALRDLLARQARVRLVCAAAPSQNELLAALVAADGIDWSRVVAFHMDEYVGLAPEAPQRFGHFLRDRLFDRVHPGEVHLIAGNADPEAECRRYAELLAAAPIDLVCLGIGENGHLAFNDPPVADFHDPALIKPVELDAACRRQQVNDGCFPALDAVPARALTLTIPALLAGRCLFCAVPGPTKREAVRQALTGPIATSCPASILRTHPRCTLYLDTAAYGA